MSKTLVIAVGQAHSRPGDIAGNIALAWRWGRDAQKKGASLLVLPELFDWGYDLEAVKKNGPSAESLRLGEIATELGIFVVAGIATAGTGGPRNSSVLFRPDGTRAQYDKVHLFEAESNVESRVFVPGEARASWEISGIRIAPLICYDLRFPELARASALEGVEILLVSSAWPASRAEIFRVLNQARAIENQLFVVSANLCGRSSSGSYAGHSMIVAPDGSLLAELGEEETLLVAKIDIEMISAIRSRLPCFKQRKPSAY